MAGHGLSFVTACTVKQHRQRGWRGEIRQSGFACVLRAITSFVGWDHHRRTGTFFVDETRFAEAGRQVTFVVDFKAQHSALPRDSSRTIAAFSHRHRRCTTASRRPGPSERCKPMYRRAVAQQTPSIARLASLLCGVVVFANITAVAGHFSQTQQTGLLVRCVDSDPRPLRVSQVGL